MISGAVRVRVSIKWGPRGHRAESRCRKQMIRLKIYEIHWANKEKNGKKITKYSAIAVKWSRDLTFHLKSYKPAIEK